MNLPSLALWQAFEEGRQFTSDDGRIFTMSVSDAGVLCLPTGKIVLCDPLVDPDYEPLVVSVDPGDYPVFIALAEGEVALAMVQFAEGEPTRFEPTVPSHLSVDSASAAFLDAKLSRLLRRKAKAGRYDSYVDRFQDALDTSPQGWSNLYLNRDLRENLILFSTFGGDGSFPSFIGYDESGKMTCLITDMFIESVVSD